MVGPPNSGEGENLTAADTEGSTGERNLGTTGPIEALLGFDMMSNSHSCFKRCVHKFNFDRLVPTFGRYFGVPVPSNSSVSPYFPRICLMMGPISSKSSILASGPQADPALFTTPLKDPVSQPPNEFVTF